MNLQSYHQQLENYIIKNQLDKALQRLREILRPGEAQDRVITLMSRLNALDKERVIGTVTESEYETRRSTLRQFILTVKSQLTAEALDPTLELREGILERLVVYCTEDRQPFFERLLDPNVFKHIVYLSYSESVPSHTDVIIYDHTVAQEAALQQLILADGPPVLIMVYGQLRWLYEEQYCDRFATANSIYSLGARLKELITVLKWMDR